MHACSGLQIVEISASQQVRCQRVQENSSTACGGLACVCCRRKRGMLGQFWRQLQLLCAAGLLVYWSVFGGDAESQTAPNSLLERLGRRLVHCWSGPMD